MMPSRRQALPLSSPSKADSKNAVSGMPSEQLPSQSDTDSGGPALVPPVPQVYRSSTTGRARSWRLRGSPIPHSRAHHLRRKATARVHRGGEAVGWDYARRGRNDQALQLAVSLVPIGYMHAFPVPSCRCLPRLSELHLVFMRMSHYICDGRDWTAKGNRATEFRRQTVGAESDDSR